MKQGICRYGAKKVTFVLADYETAQLFRIFSYKYNCHFLIYYERYDNINDAIAREKELKSWSRKKKEKLIATVNPEWRFLNEEVLKSHK